LTVAAADGTALPATLTLPDARVRGGLVALHPAYDGSRRNFLLRHLAETLPPHGIAILRFDRRPAVGHDDVPFAVQAADALAALAELRAQRGVGAAPLGVWAWSQGAWAAPLAATRSPDVAFLVLVAAAGVTPAAQMRYGTTEQLRRAGYGADALAELAALRGALEDALRRGGDLEPIVERYADRPWFPLAQVPRTLPRDARWTDMDFDPEPVLAHVRCPVLLVYGETDEWTPIDESIAVWRRAAASSGNDDIEVVRLRGAAHAPTIGGCLAAEAISPAYTSAVVDWLDRTLPRLDESVAAALSTEDT
jgi:pimeloyl-ACP methyl ester carboxylesterase